MKNLVKIGDYLRGAFTKVEMKLMELLNAGPKDPEAIETQFVFLKSRHSQLESANGEIMAILESRNVEDVEMSKEVASTKVFKVRFQEMQLNTAKALKAQSEERVSSFQGELQKEIVLMKLITILKDVKRAGAESPALRQVEPAAAAQSIEDEEEENDEKEDVEEVEEEDENENDDGTTTMDDVDEEDEIEEKGKWKEDGEKNDDEEEDEERVDDVKDEEENVKKEYEDIQYDEVKDDDEVDDVEDDELNDGVEKDVEDREVKNACDDKGADDDKDLKVDKEKEDVEEDKEEDGNEEDEIDDDKEEEDWKGGRGKDDVGVHGERNEDDDVEEENVVKSEERKYGPRVKMKLRDCKIVVKFESGFEFMLGIVFEFSLKELF